MKITDIRVDGFGVWNSISVDELPPAITLFYGPNEAGKTTLMQFVRAVLYGFSPQRRQIYLPPVHGGVPGGMLRVENHSGGFVIERRESEKDPDGDGRLVVMAENGSRQGQNLLNVLVSGVDESIFNNVFAIGIRELQELATLNDTQAAEQLYNMTSGVDRVSLVEVMRHLESSQQAIWNGDQAAELFKLRECRDKLRVEIDSLRRETQRWSNLANQRRGLIGELAEVQQRIADAENASKTVKISIQVQEPWTQRAEVKVQLDAIGQPEPLPEGCVARLDELNHQIREQRDGLLPHKKRRRGIRRELAAQPINRSLWDQSCRIEAICEHGPWMASLDDEIKRINEEVHRLQDELLVHEESLSGEAAVALSSGSAVTAQVLQQLHPAAQALREAMRKKSIARKVQKKTQQEVDEAAADMAGELGGRTIENFEEVLEETSGLVKSLRRRTKVETRLETMRRERGELDEDYHEILDEQFQNVRIMAGIGLMFVFGFVLTLTGIFGQNIMPMSPDIRFGASLLGLLCIGLAVIFKISLERKAEHELEECLDRRERMDDEIAALLRRRSEIDALLPEGRGTSASRLAAAEKDLKELEEMAPLQMERQKAAKRQHTSGRHATGADEELREARRRWRRTLHQAGLPETLSPKHVRQLAAHQQKSAKITQSLEEQRGRTEKLSHDRQVLADRLSRLTEEVGLNTGSRDPHIQLSQLETALAGQREMIATRRELQREDKQLKRELALGLRNLRRWQRERESLFAEARAADEDEVRERVDRIEEREQLEHQHRALSESLQAVIGEHCSEDEIAAQISQFGEVELERRSRALATTLQENQAHLAQLHQRQGEINQEMKTLAENPRLSAAQFELGCVEARIDEVSKKWRVLAATLWLLEEIRESYEVERQPETLSEASLYLERLTAGKYTRIWTPLGKHELRIDHQDGDAMPLDVLSRGTREAVFLSLRLALVAAYGRRGVNMPMILDDVLVNLDIKRAEAAVEILCDFAREGRQLLFFTCHQHVKAMFVAACVDARDLPANRTPGVHVVPLLEQRSPQEDAADETELETEHQEAEVPAEEPGWPEAEELPPVESEEGREAEAVLEEEAEAEEEEEEELVAEEEFVEPIVEVDEPEYEIEVVEQRPQQFERMVLEEITPPDPPVAEATDPDPFDDGFWWWESDRRPSPEKEETAA